MGVRLIVAVGAVGGAQNKDEAQRRIDPRSLHQIQAEIAPGFHQREVVAQHAEEAGITAMAVGEGAPARPAGPVELGGFQRGGRGFVFREGTGATVRLRMDMSAHPELLEALSTTADPHKARNRVARLREEAAAHSRPEPDSGEPCPDEIEKSA